MTIFPSTSSHSRLYTMACGKSCSATSQKQNVYLRIRSWKQEEKWAESANFLRISFSEKCGILWLSRNLLLSLAFVPILIETHHPTRIVIGLDWGTEVSGEENRQGKLAEFFFSIFKQQCVLISNVLKWKMRKVVIKIYVRCKIIFVTVVEEPNILHFVPRLTEIYTVVEMGDC